MIPCLLLATANSTTRRRAQSALMAVGGRLGFHWTAERLTYGGAVFAVHQAPHEARHKIQRMVMDYMCVGADRPGGGWLLSRWGCPFTEEEMQQVGSWLTAPSAAPAGPANVLL